MGLLVKAVALLVAALMFFFVGMPLLDVLRENKWPIWAMDALVFAVCIAPAALILFVAHCLGINIGTGKRRDGRK